MQGFGAVLRARRSVREYSDAAISRKQIDEIVFSALGITGPEEKTATPSANGLHPLFLRLSVRNVESLEPGLYQVVGGKEPTLLGRGPVLDGLLNAAVGEQPWIGRAAAVLTVCADMIEPARVFADQKPFGRRGTQYVFIEAGAAAQNMMLQATALNLGSVLVAGFEDEETAKLLRLSAPNEPILHVCLGYPSTLTLNEK